MNNQSRVLVTGGAGFVASHLIEALLKQGHEVTSIDDYSSGKKENHIKGCKYIKADVSDGITGNYDIIYHLAAQARLTVSSDDPKNTIDNNLRSTLAVAEYSRKNKVKVVYSNTSSDTWDKKQYQSPYTWSKWASADLLKLYSKFYGTEYVICRFYNVYGPRHVYEGLFSTVIAIFEHKKRNNQPITIVGDGKQRRYFTHVSDIVEGMLKASKYTNIEVLLGYKKKYSILDVAKMFGGETAFLPKRSWDAKDVKFNYKKTKKQIGWEAKIDIKDYIKEWKSIKY